VEWVNKTECLGGNGEPCRCTPTRGNEQWSSAAMKWRCHRRQTFKSICGTVGQLE